jgi:hypothetical protein
MRTGVSRRWRTGLSGSGRRSFGKIRNGGGEGNALREVWAAWNVLCSGHDGLRRSSFRAARRQCTDRLWPLDDRTARERTISPRVRWGKTRKRSRPVKAVVPLRCPRVEWWSHSFCRRDPACSRSPRLSGMVWRGRPHMRSIRWNRSAPRSAAGRSRPMKSSFWPLRSPPAGHRAS